MVVNPDNGLPRLKALVTGPIFDRDGRLVSKPGYDAEACVWYEPPQDFELPPVPGKPSTEDIDAARCLLVEDLLHDFPFLAPSDRANAVGALLLPFVRPMVDGPTPLHLVESPTPGTGKTLLSEVFQHIAEGQIATPTTVGKDDEEVRKKITSMLLRSQRVIILDNIAWGISSSHLAAAITATYWSDRILGKSRMVDLPNDSLWIATANNPNLTLDIARRCVRIRIDPGEDRPWERAGFRHEPLMTWVRESREDLVHALVTLAQAWITAGRPPGSARLGSFESWAEVIGGILSVAGIEGFNEDRGSLYDLADAEGREWRPFVAAWWKKFEGTWVVASLLHGLAETKEMLTGVLGGGTYQSRRSRLGKALHRMRDRQFEQLRVEVGQDSHAKAGKYRLVTKRKGEEELG